MIITTKQKIYLTLIVLVMAIIGLLFLLICPLVNRVKRLSAELEEENGIVSSYKAKSGDYLRQLQDEYTNLELKISEIDNSFVVSERAIDFILAVERVAALTGNYQEIKEISSPASPVGGPEEENILSFQVFLWGSFPNLIRFLAQLENMSYFVDNNSLQVTRIGTKDLKALSERGINVLVGDVRSIVNIKAYIK